MTTAHQPATHATKKHPPRVHGKGGAHSSSVAAGPAWDSEWPHNLLKLGAAGAESVAELFHGLSKYLDRRAERPQSNGGGLS